MPHNETYLLVATSRTPWNKGKLIGAKPRLRPKHFWAIRTKGVYSLRACTHKSGSVIDVRVTPDATKLLRSSEMTRCARTRRDRFKTATTSATRFVLRIRVSRASKGNKSGRTRCFSDLWKNAMLNEPRVIKRDQCGEMYRQHTWRKQ